MEDVLRGYGAPPPGVAWYWASAIVQRAGMPFRFLHPDWMERTAALLDAADEVLDDGELP